LTDIAGLKGRRVFVVEDEMLVSMLIEDILEEFGCIVVGPAGKLEQALVLANAEQIDIAILDVNLGGTRVFPVADALAKRGVPFIFASGYGDLELAEPHKGSPIIQKPFSPEAIGEILVAALKG
jgi:DNA-binding NtrC family response regulator